MLTDPRGTAAPEARAAFEEPLTDLELEFCRLPHGSRLALRRDESYDAQSAFFYSTIAYTSEPAAAERAVAPDRAVVRERLVRFVKRDVPIDDAATSAVVPRTDWSACSTVANS